MASALRPAGKAKPVHSSGTGIKTSLFFFGCAALTAALLTSVPACAWLGRSGYEDDRRDARYFPKENLSAEERERREERGEEAREETRRREAAAEKEYLSARETARAIDRVVGSPPRGSFIRKAGSTALSLPRAHVEVEAQGQTYLYYAGIFYFPLPDRYMVVPGPVDAVVESLPANHGAVYKGDADTYFYYFGNFFMEEDGKYRVVTPPQGTIVGYVPDGCSKSEVDGQIVYRCGDLQFVPAFFGDRVIYLVKG